jgi:glucose/arabinose dehydrogenase
VLERIIARIVIFLALNRPARLVIAVAVAIAAIAAVFAFQPDMIPKDGVPEDRPEPPAAGDPFKPIPDSGRPQVRDPQVRVQKVIERLSASTSMVFMDDGSLLVLQKNDGRVRLIANGELLREPVATFQVESASERGLLGIDADGSAVYIYVTESAGFDTRHRLYKFDWQDRTLANKRMLLDLPGTPGPNHDGGKVTVGPDGAVYAVIGDLNRNGMLQNFKNGPAPDDTSVILKIDSEGKPTTNILRATGMDLDAYYAYGIRNSFGMDFDPVTGVLWDTENGPDRYDEVNVFLPGFNSGWERVMGPISTTSATEDDLVIFEGSHYADPVFSWRNPVGVTDIEFLASDKFGGYENTIFVGDINNGYLYHFVPNETRNGLVLEEQGLDDLVADSDSELSHVIFGTGFGGITDIETGPDGYLYILSYGGSIYRLVPAQ